MKICSRDPGVLYGSSSFPSTIDVGHKKISLGELVVDAYHRSKLSTDQWNKLSESARYKLLQRELERQKT
jgi:hypothetical protein